MCLLYILLVSPVSKMHPQRRQGPSQQWNGHSEGMVRSMEHVLLGLGVSGWVWDELYDRHLIESLVDWLAEAVVRTVSTWLPKVSLLCTQRLYTNKKNTNSTTQHPHQ